MRIIKLTTTDTSTDLNSSDTVVPWTDAPIMDNPPFGFSGNQIDIQKDGIYELQSIIYSDTSNSRTNPVARFRVNGTTFLDGWGGSGYTRNSDGHTHASNSPYTIEQLNAGDYIEVVTFQEANGGSRIMESNTCVFTAKKIDDEPLRKIDGEESGTVTAGNQGVLSISNIENGETLELEEAVMVLADGQPAPTGLDMNIVSMDNNGNYTVETVVLTGDGTAVYDYESGNPVASYTNSSGSAQTVAVVVDNQTGSDQIIMSQAYGVFKQ